MLQLAGTGNIVSIIFAVLLVGFVFYNFMKSKKRLSAPPSENVKILTDQNFDQIIKTGVTLIDFWAEWCGPCKVQGPIIDEIADELGDKANICKLDVDHNRRVSSKLGIQNIPTLMLFKDGKMVQRFVGVKPKGVLMKAVNKYM
jgi:thioredoxin 1